MGWDSHRDGETGSSSSSDATHHALLANVALLVLLLAAGLIAAGCGDSAAAAEGEEVVIGLTTGHDPTGFMVKVIEACNKGAEGKWRIKQITTPPSADAQREQIIRRLAGKDSAMDIMSLDVVWTAEFADAGWLVDLSKRVEPDKKIWVPASLNTVYYKGKYWAVSVGTNVAVLFYRTDIIKTPPKTWEEMATMAKAAQKQHPGIGGFLWQATPYEGLTVDAMEFIYAAKGGVLSENGKESIIDKGDGTLYAFKFMRDLFKDGVTPKAVTTYREEESRQAFQQGKGVFLRNWSYVWALANGDDSKVAGKFDVVPLPSFKGRQAAGVLGGLNYGISRYSKHPELAYDAIKCIASPENSRQKLLIKGDLPAMEAPYVDAEVKKAFPFIGTMRTALNTAYNRPVSPYYNDITYALSKTSNDVASGRLTPEAAVKKLDRSIQLAIDGNGEI